MTRCGALDAKAGLGGNRALAEYIISLEDKIALVDGYTDRLAERIDEGHRVVGLEAGGDLEQVLEVGWSEIEYREEVLDRRRRRREGVHGARSGTRR